MGTTASVQPKYVLVISGINCYALNAAIAEYAKNHGWHLNTSFIMHGSIPWGWDGDGVISQLGKDPDHSRFVQSIDCPVVDMDLWQENLGLTRVLPDNQEIGRIAASYFVENQFHHFATYSWSARGESRTSEQRTQAFEQCLKEYGHECEHLFWGEKRGEQDDTASNRLAWLGIRLKDLPKPLAVFAPNDERGAEVLRACHTTSLMVPEQVSILGAENIRLICESLPVPLSSIDIDMNRWGYEAASMLDRLMDGEAAPSGPVIIPPIGVVMRKSSEMIAIDDSHVVRAIRYIWTHYADQINVPQIVEASGASRRYLETKFREHLGRSILDELIRFRLDLVCEQLERTDVPVGKICFDCGFGTKQQMFLFFKRRFQITPLQYRDQFRSKRVRSRP